MTIEGDNINDVDFFINYMSRKHTHTAYIYYDNRMIDSIMIYDNDIDSLNELKYLNDIKNVLTNEQKLLLKVQIKIEC